MHHSAATGPAVLQLHAAALRDRVAPGPWSSGPLSCRPEMSKALDGREARGQLDHCQFAGGACRTSSEGAIAGKLVVIVLETGLVGR